MKTFCDTNEVPHVAVEANLVELTDPLHTEQFLPVSGLDVGLEQQLTRRERRKILQVRASRKTQDQTVTERLYTEGR
jgi:hypothetical protein